MVVLLARQGGLDAVFDVPEEMIRSGPRGKDRLTSSSQPRQRGRETQGVYS
jgi:membrane fusion protein, multidrug efflux system